MQKLAKIVSRLFDPIFESPFIIFLASQLAEAKVGWLKIFLISLLFSYFIPILFFFFSLQKGWISDWDTTKRKERYNLYIFSFFSILICLTIFYFLKDKYLFLFYFKLLLPVFLFFLITFFWKISGHTLVNSIFVLLLYFYFNKLTILYLGIFLLMLVSWSRIVLKKHNLAQVLAGVLLPPLIYFYFN